MNTSRIHPLLVQLYGEDLGTSTLGQLSEIVERYRDRLQPNPPRPFDRHDAILIAYPDHLQESDRLPLRTLSDFCVSHFSDIISGIHLLPFYPSSSDDGFSVIDYRAVDPRYGNWEEINALARHFRLMFDAVVNHVSADSDWFQGMLRGEDRYQDYFLTPRENADLTQVVRPRALPLLTEVPTAHGSRKVWTTFSADQVDLNYKNPAVLLEIIDTLLFYAASGAEYLRLDAIAYLWKEEGTPSIHLPQTHWIIQLFRAVLDEVAPQVVLVTETNVPHTDNVSYFGNGVNEAQMVYNFSLPPLVLHAFDAGSAEVLSGWARQLAVPSDTVTYFNFLASHDGIGVNPLRGILPEAEIDALALSVRSHGGLLSYKSLPGGEVPYEFNINYFDALSDPDDQEIPEISIERFITAHAILLALRGIPGIYLHSLIGSRGWPEGAALSGTKRTINREKLSRSEVEAALAQPNSRRARIFNGLSALLRARATSAAFDPVTPQEIVEGGVSVFGVLRRSDEAAQALCLHNVSGALVRVRPDEAGFFGQQSEASVLSGSAGASYDPEHGVALGPYQYIWLVKR